MLLGRVFLSCLLAGVATARIFQETLLENILATGRAAATPSPTQPGLISTCDAYYRVQRGDYCGTIVEKFHRLTLRKFYAWNPAVKPDCSELLEGYYVCVGISDAPTSPAAQPTAAPGLLARAEPVPSPTQSGIASDCNNYYKVITNDTCIGVAYQHAITLFQFYSWNPAVGSDCQVLLAGYYVCVGVSDTTTTSSTSTTATSQPPPTNVPEPTQPGIATDCTEYYEAQPGDTCVLIVQKYEAQGSVFTLQAFERWNPAVGRDCKSLLAGYFYCVATPKMHR